MSAQGSVGKDGCGVIARNFPAAWLASSALTTLSLKVQSLLERLGKLGGAPVVSQGPLGFEAVAWFDSPEIAQEAVRTLHGTDLRTNAEKRAANFEAPKESERFWLQPYVAPAGAGAAAPGAPAAAATALAKAAAAPAPAPAPAKRLRPGVYLSPLPKSWGQSDVLTLAAPYGGVQKCRLEVGEDGQQGAFIDFQNLVAAKDARGGLDGLSLLGVRLKCVMQEEPEPEKPVLHYVIHVDELAMPSRPEVNPCLDDREVFLRELPTRIAATEEAVRSWLVGFGGKVQQVHLLKGLRQAYVRFRSHAEACKALRALRASGPEGAKAAWSESERIQKGYQGAYGIDILKRVCGAKGSGLAEMTQALRASSLTVALGSPAKQPQQQQPTGAAAPQMHFALKCEQAAQADECRALLSKALAQAHDVAGREVQNSLVLRGFPASWSEKGIKFVFAPFGGLASIVFEDERSAEASADAVVPRRAYVKLRNASATNKAVTNLHQTNVGDGDLVEECVLQCQRWHPRSWSDGTFRANIFIDQLAMIRRPEGAGPSSEDRELFVRNLPLKDMNRQQLQEYFEGFGEVDELRLILDPFTEEPIGEGYVRFVHHRDAQRCMEALTPDQDQEAEPNDLIGSWSESERVLQRKANCYRFNLIAELVGQDGSGLEKLKTEAKLKGIWLLADTLEQRDRQAPAPAGSQLHFVGRLHEEAHVQLFRELLERALEEAHARIADRLDRRKRKAKEAAAAEEAERKAAAKAAAAAAAPAAAGAAAAAASQGANPWAAPPKPEYWGMNGANAWSARPPVAAPGAPPGSQAYPAPAPYPQAAPGPWGQPAQAQAAATVFEATNGAQRDQTPAGDGKKAARSRSRRRNRDRGAEKEGDGAKEGRRRRK
eukprot:TRINITY_DN1918_c0_g3_i1.p1 TRINITY_DN1918_c0_g3~~TRINITY_DN1918_c0_g3_i1.p1  ORF type:complete len:885 (-),score=233.56 TRINITY_DN1918_c0_g3_i1:92-2746(-)